MMRAISPSVIYGMLAGIGLLMFGAQVHVMVDDRPRGNGLENLMSIPEAVYKGVFPLDGSSHHLAAALGISTILLLVGWNTFAPRKVRWIPGALVGVGFATAAAAVLGLPVRYVELGEGLLSAVNITPVSALSSFMSVETLIIVISVAFVASAETLLSASAVDQMAGTRTSRTKALDGSTFSLRDVQIATYPAGATFGPRVLQDYEFVWIEEGDVVCAEGVEGNKRFRDQRQARRDEDEVTFPGPESRAFRRQDLRYGRHGSLKCCRHGMANDRGVWPPALCGLH